MTTATGDDDNDVNGDGAMGNEVQEKRRKCGAV
jgi:hypothetical protein